MKFNTVYKTTHVVSGMFYYGRHITENINDNYYGSGIHPLLKDKKHLTKEIVAVCDTPEEMIQLERELHKKYIKDPLCMNNIIGEIGENYYQHSQKTKDAIGRSNTGKKRPDAAKRIALLNKTNNPALRPEFREKRLNWFNKLSIQEQQAFSKKQSIATLSRDPALNKKVGDALRGRARPKKECQYCHTFCGIGRPILWHVRKCEKNRNEQKVII